MEWRKVCVHAEGWGMGMVGHGEAIVEVRPSADTYTTFNAGYCSQVLEPLRTSVLSLPLFISESARLGSDHVHGSDRSATSY
jgi:hypothetical protein